MPRIHPVEPANADAKAKPLFEAVQKKLGRVPNFMKTMAHTPATLAAYLNFLGALSEGKAALVFAKQVLGQRGEVTDAEIEAVKAAGFSDGDVLEIVANVALNIFSNYVNNVSEPDVDFPRAQIAQHAA